MAGEEVEIERSRRGKSTSAELISILQPLDVRRTPECDYHRDGSCGGCPWMFVDYPTQPKQKQARLTKVLERINSNTAGCSMLGARETLNYRNRAQFKSDGVKLGYVAQGSHEIADVTQCPILNDVNQVHLRALRQSLPNSDWRPLRIVNGQRLILMMSRAPHWSIGAKPFGRVIPNKTSNYALG